MTDTTDPQTAEPLRIPIAHSVRYAARGLPEVPNQYGPGVLAPSEITLTYRAAPDSGLGRVHAYVAGRLWVDGVEIPLLPGGPYGQHYDDGLDGWPEWLAEEARLHDPDAAPSAPADRAGLSDVDRKFLTFALDLAADQMASRGDEFDADDEDAMERLRRVAGEEQQAETQARECPPGVHSMFDFCPGDCGAPVADEAACTCASAGDAFVPAGHYADCPCPEARQQHATPPAVVAEPGKEG